MCDNALNSAANAIKEIELQHIADSLLDLVRRQKLFLQPQMPTDRDGVLIP